MPYYPKHKRTCSSCGYEQTLRQGYHGSKWRCSKCGATNYLEVKI